MQNQITIVHFMSRGQVRSVANCFPSAESYLMALEHAYTDEALQRLRRNTPSTVVVRRVK